MRIALLPAVDPESAPRMDARRAAGGDSGLGGGGGAGGGGGGGAGSWCGGTTESSMEIGVAVTKPGESPENLVSELAASVPTASRETEAIKKKALLGIVARRFIYI
jgi:hypothetical protein